MNKERYYSRKLRSEIVKDIFSWLLISGAVALAATSPYFVSNLLGANRRFKKYSHQRISTAFDNLRRQGAILIEKQNQQIYISLTPEGKRKAGIFQIDKLRIKEPKKWDKKWRLVIFDIAQKKRLIREAMRGKLKQLGFYHFQKSVWIHPFNCSDEIELIKKFFGLTDDEVQLVIAENIGKENKWKKVFELS